MGDYILKDSLSGKYLCNGSFDTNDKTKATKFDKDKAEKLKTAFNTFTKRLNIDVERAV